MATKDKKQKKLPTKKEQEKLNKIYAVGYRDGAVDYLSDIVVGFIREYTTKHLGPTLIECGGANNREFFHMLVCNILNRIPYCAVKEITKLGKERVKSWENNRKRFGEEIHQKVTEKDAW